MSKRDFLSVRDTTSAELSQVLEVAAQTKRETKEGRAKCELAGKCLGMIFRKPSLRTRVSFERGMLQLGGDAMYISDQEIGIGKREAVKDIAKVLSRYVDAIMIRTFAHQEVEELARYANIPVVNGLTNLLHPCQIVGDLLTVQEHKGKLDGLRIAYVGDGNNVANSWINAATRTSIDLWVATPQGFEPDGYILDRGKTEAPGRMHTTHDPQEAVDGADVVYSDVWASMGQESEREERVKTFSGGGFQLNEKLLARADSGAIVLHCLPAHRGEEITDEVMDGPHSAVYDQAENRMHAQKSILLHLIDRWK